MQCQWQRRPLDFAAVEPRWWVRFLLDAVPFIYDSKSLLTLVGAPLNSAVLAAAPLSMQKQMLGETLFSAIARSQPLLAGKLTGIFCVWNE